MVSDFFRLLNELLESQKSYQNLLRTSLEDQRLHVQLLTQTTQQMRMIGQLLTLTPGSILRSSETGFSSHHTLNSEDDVSSQAGGGLADLIPEQEGSLHPPSNILSPCCHQHHPSPNSLPLNIRDPKLVEFLSELHLDRNSIEKVMLLTLEIIRLILFWLRN